VVSPKRASDYIKEIEKQQENDEEDVKLLGKE
jgi:hypothetical protein